MGLEMIEFLASIGSLFLSLVVAIGLIVSGYLLYVVITHRNNQLGCFKNLFLWMMLIMLVAFPVIHLLKGGL